MISLALFPFLTFAITSRVFGMRTDEAFLEQFLRHTTEVFMHGVGSK
jgi:hypothetical protein